MEGKEGNVIEWVESVWECVWKKMYEVYEKSAYGMKKKAKKSSRWMRVSVWVCIDRRNDFDRYNKDKNTKRKEREVDSRVEQDGRAATIFKEETEKKHFVSMKNPEIQL